MKMKKTEEAIGVFNINLNKKEEEKNQDDKDQDDEEEIKITTEEDINEIDEEAFKVYEPFFEGLVIEKPSILYYNLQFIVRRVLLIVIAMYLMKYGWLQLMIFVWTS